MPSLPVDMGVPSRYADGQRPITQLGSRRRTQWRNDAEM